MKKSLSNRAPRWGAALLGAAVLAATVSACGSSSSAADAKATNAAATNSASASGSAVDLSGVTLSVGDEYGTFQGPLQASGQLANLPYKIKWSTFVSGPGVTAAEVGGSVDVGEMSDPPPIFAQAAGDNIKIVGAQEPLDPATQSNFAIVVQPKSSINSVADLKGKKVSLLNGTILQYIAIQALLKSGLSYSDITPVNVNPPSGATAALKRGSVDALVTSLAAAQGLVQQGQGRILLSGAGLSRSLNYLVASGSALNNPKKSAAIGDLLQRLAKAQQWVNANPTAFAAVYAKNNSVPLSVATTVVKALPLQYVPISAPILAAQQSEADIFKQQGIVKTTLDTSKEFDLRFNSLVTAATGVTGPTS
jgi:sulfonate transport system substrate-binding protein